MYLDCLTTSHRVPYSVLAPFIGNLENSPGESIHLLKTLDPNSSPHTVSKSETSALSSACSKNQQVPSESRDKLNQRQQEEINVCRIAAHAISTTSKASDGSVLLEFTYGYMKLVEEFFKFQAERPDSGDE